MITIEIVLLILALICFLLSTVGLVSRINFQSLGLCFLAAAMLLRGHLLR
jgi:hypothetical protein